ncbi:helix-turn-helix transcriptional regulator [Mesorhizobium marinum]|uniref:helix-turn-helix transcriptional regulator n=1 Tax=Mesorhizobium marinum TaxID=3228790 RepID=UPI00346741B5
MTTSLLTRENIRDHFGVTNVTIHRWRKDPSLQFPPPIKIKRRVFWRQEDIERWCESRIASAA